MSDAAFKTAPYPAYTTDQLLDMISRGALEPHSSVIRAEIERRHKRDTGDVSVMTAGERLRFARATS
jgi:hypothetical protein